MRRQRSRLKWHYDDKKAGPGSAGRNNYISAIRLNLINKLKPINHQERRLLILLLGDETLLIFTGPA